MGRPKDIPELSIWVEWEEFCGKAWDYHTDKLEGLSGRKWKKLSNNEKQAIMRFASVFVSGTQRACFRVSAGYLLKLGASQAMLRQHTFDVNTTGPEFGQPRSREQEESKRSMI